jgi:hypothetical protein
MRLLCIRITVIRKFTPDGVSADCIKQGLTGMLSIVELFILYPQQYSKPRYCDHAQAQCKGRPRFPMETCDFQAPAQPKPLS